MKIKLSHLRKIIQEEAARALRETDLEPAAAPLQAGDRVDAAEKFDQLLPGDSITVGGVPATVVSLTHDLAELTYVPKGSATKQTVDYRYAYAEFPDETPEEEIFWLGRGAVPQGLRRPPRRKPVASPYD